MAVLVGKRAPSFKAAAVIDGKLEDEFSLDRYLGKKHVLFFFYPADFSRVCPTEILAFQDRLEEFERRGVAVVGCSTDSQYAHLAWQAMPREKGGIAGVNVPAWWPMPRKPSRPTTTCWAATTTTPSRPK